MLCVSKIASEDLFTSLGQMVKLVETEIYVTNSLRALIDVQSKKLDEAKLLLKDFDFIAESSKNDPENFIGNPSNAVLLIKKLTKDLNKIVETINIYPKINATLTDIKQKKFCQQRSTIKVQLKPY